MISYELAIKRKIDNIQPNLYCNLHNLHAYPLEISKAVLKILVEHACLGQNHAPIMLSRNLITSVKKDWLLTHLMNVAKECIDYEDEWEYRRFFELIIISAFELKQKVYEIGIVSSNLEVREAAEDCYLLDSM